MAPTPKRCSGTMDGGSHVECQFEKISVLHMFLNNFCPCHIEEKLCCMSLLMSYFLTRCHVPLTSVEHANVFPCCLPE